MRWAIAVSIFVHFLALGLVFKGYTEREKGYPKAIIVRLSSPPPARGVPEPATNKASQSIEKPAKMKQPETTRTAEINEKKKPKPQPAKPKPVKNETVPEEIKESKSKGLPEGVELGSEFGAARLDASGFDSPYYLNILFNKIRNQWDNPIEATTPITCTIYFAVGRDGHIIDSAIETSSGMPAYDQAALRAILGSKPPPLPNQFGSDELGIHLDFQYLPNE